jgi:hypothetical protein
MERRINNNSDDEFDEFSAMWFEQDPKTIFLALWSEEYNNNNNNNNSMCMYLLRCWINSASGY